MSINIDPKNKGKFTATKKKSGKSTEELKHSKNALTRKRAVFAENAKKWNHKKNLSAKLDALIEFDFPKTKAILGIGGIAAGAGAAGIGAYHIIDKIKRQRDWQKNAGDRDVLRVAKDLYIDRHGAMFPHNHPGLKSKKVTELSAKLDGLIEFKFSNVKRLPYTLGVLQSGQGEIVKNVSKGIKPTKSIGNSPLGLAVRKNRNKRLNGMGQVAGDTPGSTSVLSAKLDNIILSDKSGDWQEFYPASETVGFEYNLRDTMRPLGGPRTPTQEAQNAAVLSALGPVKPMSQLFREDSESALRKLLSKSKLRMRLSEKPGNVINLGLDWWNNPNPFGKAMDINQNDKLRQQAEWALVLLNRRFPKVCPPDGALLSDKLDKLIEFNDPRPRNPLGEFAPQQEGVADPNSMAKTYAAPVKKAAGYGGVALAGGAIGAVGGAAGKDVYSAVKNLLAKKVKKV